MCKVHLKTLASALNMFVKLDHHTLFFWITKASEDATDLDTWRKENIKNPHRTGWFRHGLHIERTKIANKLWSWRFAIKKEDMDTFIEDWIAQLSNEQRSFILNEHSKPLQVDHTLQLENLKKVDLNRSQACLLGGKALCRRMVIVL